MADGNSKRKRNKRCKPPGTHSKGVHGATKHPLTTLQKVVMGKGLYQSFEPLGGRTR